MFYTKIDWKESKRDFFKKHIHKKCSENEGDIDDIKEIIDYFDRCEFEDFSDYEEAIQYLFLLVGKISISGLGEEYEKKYLDAVSIGLKYAGESQEVGYIRETPVRFI